MKTEESKVLIIGGGAPFSTGRHWLEPVGRRAAIEGSLSLTVERNFDPELSRRGVKGRGKQQRTGMGVGGGSWHLLEEGRIKTEDPQSWYNSNRYKVANLTK